MPFAREVNQNPIQGKLALLMPAYRFDDKAKFVLQSTMALASDETAVLISDDSENPEKWDWMIRTAQQHPNIHIYCHKKRLGTFKNWGFLLGLGNTKYACYLGDDDCFTPEYFSSSVKLLEENNDAASASGIFLQHYKNRDPYLLDNHRGPRTEDNNIERLDNYAQFRLNEGNVVNFCITRRSALAHHSGYLTEHPFIGSFFDWIMAYGVVAQGKYLMHSDGGYWYDASNWTDPQKTLESDAKHYEQVGIPASFNAFHRLHWAIEFVHYFLGRYAPDLPYNERLKMAEIHCSKYASSFNHNIWQTHQADFQQLFAGNLEAENAVNNILSINDVRDPMLFRYFAQLIAFFAPERAQTYLAFVEESMKDGAAR